MNIDLVSFSNISHQPVQGTYILVKFDAFVGSIIDSNKDGNTRQNILYLLMK